MLLNYKYISPSRCFFADDQATLNLSTDLQRKEKVSFLGKLKHPLIFRDAMLMLREIVITDLTVKKKSRVDFFNWLNQEIERQMRNNLQIVPGIKENLKNKIAEKEKILSEVMRKKTDLVKKRTSISSRLEQMDYWKEFNRIKPEFMRFLRSRDPSLVQALDPVITVHPDQVSFEAFSLDESLYGCLSIKMEEFDLIKEPQLGTTNIDFSKELAEELKRFRTFNEVEFSINPEGFIVDTGTTPEYVEKKIDLPETWIKGFNQVSAAASLEGITIELKPVDIHDICALLKSQKANRSPRYMHWILEPGEYIKIIFKPWDRKIVLSEKYQGIKPKEVKIWGRRRWLVLEKLIPIASSFKLKMLGFGMPYFIIVDMVNYYMTVGFSSWSSNDWVRGTAFNILGGFIGRENMEISNLLKKNRMMYEEQIKKIFENDLETDVKASLGALLRKGKAYFDPIKNLYRYRQLLNVPIPPSLFEITSLEADVLKLIKSNVSNFSLSLNEKKDLTIKGSYELINKRRYYRTTREPTNTEIVLDADKQFKRVKCQCKDFKKGARNISEPCSHILSLYIKVSSFIDSNLIPEKEYSLEDLGGMK